MLRCQQVGLLCCQQVLVIARDLGVGHSFLIAMEQVVTPTTSQAEVSLAGCVEIGASHCGERRVALDQDGATAGGDGAHAHGRAARERIEHQAVGLRVHPQQLRTQLDRFRARMPVGVADLGHLEDVVQSTSNAGGRENVRGPATCAVRHVDLVAVKVVGENSAPSTTQRAGTTRLLSIATIPPGDPGRRIERRR